jgi:hypothetical protein
VVRRITLLKSPPTIVPVLRSVKEIEFNVLNVPLVSVAQLLPLSVVFMIRPFTPTANPVFEVGKLTALSELPRNPEDQFFPPSLVRHTTPFWPTAIPVLISVNITPRNSAVVLLF